MTNVYNRINTRELHENENENENERSVSIDSKIDNQYHRVIIIHINIFSSSSSVQTLFFIIHLLVLMQRPLYMHASNFSWLQKLIKGLVTLLAKNARAVC